MDSRQRQTDIALIATNKTDVYRLCFRAVHFIWHVCMAWIYLCS